MPYHFRLKFLVISCIVLLGISFFFLISSKNLNHQPKPTSPNYVVVMVGDSMTEALGNFDELKKFLSDYYVGKSFEVLNYGFGATNILSVMDRITKQTKHGREFRPIEDIDYDLILIESFGENPLSQYPKDEGLKYQVEELDKIVATLKETNPKGKIIFMATISPNKVIFAQNQVDLSAEKKADWVNERIAYMKNHIAYASSHKIPVINIFEKSLLENGDGNSDYISIDDYIHPSPKGIVFISREIADFIYKNSIFPH